MDLSKSTTKRKIALLGAASLSLALTVTGCTTSTGGGTAVDGSVSHIRSVFAADPHTFAPFDGTAVDDYVAASLMYAPLVYKDEGNVIVPGLAEKWDVKPEGGVFTIRKGATCGDGTEITPTVVANSLQAFADGDSSFPTTTFGPGKPTFKADDSAGTVTVGLAQPWTDMLNGLALPGSGIVCAAGLKDVKGTTAGTVPGAISGPYLLEKKQPGVLYEFKLREDFNTWPEFAKPLPGKPAETLSFTVTNEGSAVTNQVLAGTMDAAVIRGKDMVRLEEAKNVITERIPAANLFVAFNERPGHPFTDEAKRRAVAQVLNRDAFNQAANGGLGEVAASFAMPAVTCFNEDPSMLIVEDPAAAAKELKGLKIRVLGSQAFGPNGAANTYVAEALRQAGADVELQNVDNATWAANGRQKPESWDLIVFGNINAAATMWGVMSTFVGPAVENGGTNWTGFEDPTSEKYVSEAMKESDEAARCKIYTEAQKHIIQDARVIPLSTLASMVATREGFSVRAPNKTRADNTMRIGK